MLTADVRLDNRAELSQRLDVDELAMSDAELILAAYQTWSEGCTDYLLGDFAFAVWDERKGTLFCARDHFGVKPFYYTVTETEFLFSSEVAALARVVGAASAVDEAWLADFITGAACDQESTLYKTIKRLAPAHCLTVAPDGVSLRRYWGLKLAAPETPAAPYAEFRRLFTQSVACRLPASKKLGAMLSGGLDSSSIARVAAECLSQSHSPPLITFSAVFDETPQWNERPFIEAALDGGAITPVFVPSDHHDPFDGFEQVLGEQGCPFFAPSLMINRRIHHAAAMQGVNVLLDGHGGDEVVSFGYGRLVELAIASKWLRLWMEVNGLAATYGGNATLVVWNYFKRYSRVGDVARRIKRRLKSSNSSSDVGTPRPAPVLAAGRLASATDSATRWRRWASLEPDMMMSEGERHLALMTSNLNAYAFEVLDVVAARAGVECRYPFWDKRLVEFCLALPSDEKLRRGWGRYVMRMGLAGVLPEAIRWRRDKFDFGPHIVNGLITYNQSLLDLLILEDSEEMSGWINLEVARGAYDRVRKAGVKADGGDVQMVWRTAAIALWRRNETFRSAESSMQAAPSVA